MPYKFYRNSDKKVTTTNFEYSMIKDQFHLYDLLCECWSKETCAPRLRNKWSKVNKTCGQCSITAFLIQDIFGGEVFGINTCAGIHCFNKIGEIVFDLTSEQFENASELEYKFDMPQNRETHFADEEKFYRYLLLKEILKNKTQNKNTEF